MGPAAIDRSAHVSEACQRFLEELCTWIYECLERCTNVEPSDGHDQLTYTTGWVPYLEHVVDDTVLALLKSTRDGLAEHCQAMGMWRSGYWKRQEAHHGAEYCDLLLPSLCELDPDDEDTSQQLLDASELIANLAPEIPELVDHKAVLFDSFWFGTEQVARDSDDGANVPAHLLRVSLCLLAYRISKDESHLNLAQVRASPRAGAICAADMLPLAPTGAGPAYHHQGEVRGVGSQTRAEDVLASEGCGAFLDFAEADRGAHVDECHRVA